MLRLTWGLWPQTRPGARRSSLASAGGFCQGSLTHRSARGPLSGGALRRGCAVLPPAEEAWTPSRPGSLGQAPPHWPWALSDLQALFPGISLCFLHVRVGGLCGTYTCVYYPLPSHGAHWAWHIHLLSSQYTEPHLVCHWGTHTQERTGNFSHAQPRAPGAPTEGFLARRHSPGAAGAARSGGSGVQSTRSHPSLPAPPTPFPTREQRLKPLTPQDRCEVWKGPGWGRAHNSNVGW